MQSGAAAHTRFAATLQLPKVVKLTTLLIDSFDTDLLHGLQSLRRSVVRDDDLEILSRVGLPRQCIQAQVETY